MLLTILLLLPLLTFGLTPCETGDDCPDGYSCFNDPGNTTLVCLSVTGDTANAQVGVSFNGVTFDVCTSDDDCIGQRSCRLIEDTNVEDCDSRPGCTCLSPEPVRCAEDDQCDEHEICAETLKFGPICVSEVAVENGAIPVVGQDTEDNPTVDDQIPDDDDIPENESTPGTALVLEPCLTTSDCLPPRKCLDITGEPDIICPENPLNECVCGYLDIPKCDSDGDCAEGETCFPREGSHDVCVSKSVLAKSSDSDAAASPDALSSIDDLSGSAEPDTDDAIEGTPEGAVEDDDEEIEEGVCIDIELLEDHSREDLVFAEHRLARVLCDVDGNCATAGHMVKWMGHVMMMKSYCDDVGCVKGVRKVNSPRYTRGGVVKSRNSQLVFMTVATRFESRVEELVLSTAIRFGL